MQETWEMWIRSWVKKIPWRREWQPTSLFLPGESHGQRSLEGYSPCGRQELDMNEMTEYARNDIYCLAYVVRPQFSVDKCISMNICLIWISMNMISMNITSIHIDINAYLWIPKQSMCWKHKLVELICISKVHEKGLSVLALGPWAGSQGRAHKFRVKTPSRDQVLLVWRPHLSKQAKFSSS